MFKRQVVIFALATVLGAGAAWGAGKTTPARVYPDESLTGPPIMFVAVLSADEESLVTESPGSGRAEFILDRQTLTLSWKTSFKDLTSAPIAVRVHGPQTPGGEAGALFDLAPNGVKSPLEGSHQLTDGELRYLLTDRLYVNIATAKYKQGELRGQLQRMRPTNTPTQ